MNCKICGNVLVGRRKDYCGARCRERAKTLRRKDKRTREIFGLMEKRGGVCEDCGHDTLRSLFFYHDTLNGSYIADLLIRALNAEALEILGECKLICRNCYWEKYYG